MAAFGSEHDSGRPLVRRREDDGPRAARSQRRDVDAEVVDWDRDCLAAGGARRSGDGADRARILERDATEPVARERAQDDPEALGEPAADHDLVGMRVDCSHPTQVGREDGAQLRIAARVAVVERAVGRASACFANRPCPVLARNQPEVGDARLEVGDEAGLTGRRRRGFGRRPWPGQCGGHARR